MSSNNPPLINKYALAVGLLPVVACLLATAFAAFSTPMKAEWISILMLPTPLAFGLLALIFGVSFLSRVTGSAARRSHVVVLSGSTVFTIGMAPASFGFLMRLLKYPNWDLFLYRVGGPVVVVGALIVAVGVLLALFSKEKAGKHSMSEG